MSESATFAPVLGQGEELALLSRQARSLCMHHGVLIAGAIGSGKTTVARNLAAALLCPEQTASEGPCGSCRTCRKVARGNHPDLHELTPPEDKFDIPVEDVRNLREVLDRLPVEGRARVVLIDPADRLNEEGQNTLLKTLEEPGRETFLVLVTSRPEGLLETVRSRATCLQVRLLSAQKIFEELQHRDVGDEGWRRGAAERSRGALGLALQLCTEHAVQLQDLVVDVCGTDHRLRAVATSRTVLEGTTGRQEAAERARLFLYLLRTELRARALRDLESGPKGAYCAAHVDQWTSRFEPLLAAETDLDLRIPPEQVLTGVLLQW